MNRTFLLPTLLDYLEAEGELDNTLIIYTADQGMFLGEHDESIRISHEVVLKPENGKKQRKNKKQ